MIILYVVNECFTCFLNFFHLIFCIKINDYKNCVKMIQLIEDFKCHLAYWYLFTAQTHFY